MYTYIYTTHYIHIYIYSNILGLYPHSTSLVYASAPCLAQTAAALAVRPDGCMAEFEAWRLFVSIHVLVK